MTGAYRKIYQRYKKERRSHYVECSTDQSTMADYTD